MRHRLAAFQVKFVETKQIFGDFFQKRIRDGRNTLIRLWLRNLVR